MSLYVLDTDIVTLYFRGHPIVTQNVTAHAIEEVTISIMTVDEQLTGWYMLARQARQASEIARAYDQLGKTIQRMNKWHILAYTETAIARVARLKALKLNVGIMDLRIAAIALENEATVVTRNRRDFGRIPDLMLEDWSV